MQERMWLSRRWPDRRWVLCARLGAASLGAEGQPRAPPEHRPASVGADGLTAECSV